MAGRWRGAPAAILWGLAFASVVSLFGYLAVIIFANDFLMSLPQVPDAASGHVYPLPVLKDGMVYATLPWAAAFYGAYVALALAYGLFLLIRWLTDYRPTRCQRVKGGGIR